MKMVNFFISMVLLTSFLGCEKKSNKQVNSLDVETYIALLKSNKFDSLNLPAFTYIQIPELLEYRNDSQIISNFAHNPISSYYQSECKLGMYVLWTVESIRAVSIDSEYLMKRFPSQNPILTHRDTVGLDLVTDSISHAITATAYYDWWENNKNEDFDTFHSIDPLEDTEYKWH